MSQHRFNAPIGWWYAWRKAQHGKDEALRFFYVLHGILSCRSTGLKLRGKRSAPLSHVHPLWWSSTRSRNHNLAEWLRLEFELKGLKPALLSASLLDADRFLSAVRDFIPKKNGSCLLLSLRN